MALHATVQPRRVLYLTTIKTRLLHTTAQPKPRTILHTVVQTRLLHTIVQATMIDAIVQPKLLHTTVQMMTILYAPVEH